MEENNFNAGNNYVHSEPASVKSGSGLSKKSSSNLLCYYYNRLNGHTSLCLHFKK